MLFECQGCIHILPTRDERNSITLNYQSSNQKLKGVSIEHLVITSSVVALGFKHENGMYSSYWLYPTRKIDERDMWDGIMDTSEYALKKVLESNYRFKFDPKKRLFLPV